MDAPSAWPDGNDETGRRRDGIEQDRDGPGRRSTFKDEPEACAAEDGDEKPGRVAPFAANQVHQRDEGERHPEHIRVEDAADDLGRPHEFGMRAVDPAECLCGAGVEAAQRHPAPTDGQQQQRECHSGDERANQAGAESQTEPLVGGGQMVVDMSPQPLRHASCVPPMPGQYTPGACHASIQLTQVLFHARNIVVIVRKQSGPNFAA